MDKNKENNTQDMPVKDTEDVTNETKPVKKKSSTKSTSKANQVKKTEVKETQTDDKTKTTEGINALKILYEKETFNTTLNEAPAEEEPEKSKRLEKEAKKEVVYDYPRYYDTPVLEGLSSEIVAKRVEDGLLNIGNENKGKSILRIILDNSLTFFNMLYLVITILFISLRAYDNLMFLITIIPNLIIGIVQEIKAKLSIDKLSLMHEPTTTVVRDGKKIEIGVKEVVLDDIIFYTSGKQICADSVVIDGFAEINESLLTGEADAIVKNPGDQLLSGSYVVSGVCIARVDKIGKDNYIEKLSKDAKMYQKPKSELLRSLNIILKVVSFLVLPLAILTYIASSSGLAADFLGLNRDSIIRTASSMLAMIPAGLFLLTSLALAVSVVRLAQHKTLVQELYCIEMLARVNVLCLDKTGTITDGSMRVTDCIEIKNQTPYTIREIIGSMMYSFEDSNPTSDALVKYFDRNQVLAATGKIPFSSKRKFSAVTFENEGTFVLGAPEFILNNSHKKILDKVNRFAEEGYRVLVLVQTNDNVTLNGAMPKNVNPICIIVLQDHIREDANDTIDYFKQNGVDVKVISGDNPITVSHIAKRAGVIGAERYINLSDLTDDEVRESIFDYNVFGRVSPTQKKILVQTLKEHKKIVAMTGDGVNDILALKEADCSIAMASGSEATRYVSHLVLTDSNFASMPKVVQEGRRVINNIQKTSVLYLTKTVFSILLTVLYIILGFQLGAIKMSYPFNAKNLYMIEFFAIGIPSFFLALQPNTDLVKGKFLSNVFKTIIPGAVTVLILHIILNLLRITPGFEYLQTHDAVFRTILTLATTAVSLIVLHQVSKPYNWLRRGLFASMLLGCFLLSTNAIPMIDLELSYRKPISDYEGDLTLEVSGTYRWILNGEGTSIAAIEMPDVFIDESSNGFLSPVISVYEGDYWVLNGHLTSVKINEAEKNLNLKVVDGYWYLNDVKTKAKAHEVPTYNVDTTGYIIPKLAINENEFWTLDGKSTGIIKNGSTVNLKVDENDEWRLNESRTYIKANLEVKIINPDEYVVPSLSIKTKDDKRYFVLDGVLTNIEALVTDDINLAVVGDKWTINDGLTSIAADKLNDTNGITDYVTPILDINSEGSYTINNEDTEIPAKDNLLVTEIIITIVLIQLIIPLMYLFDKLLKNKRYV